MEHGLVHIYTGDGKGKTSAALGLVFRAVGYGKRIKYIRFVKSGFSGELKTISYLKDWIAYEQVNPFNKSIFALTEAEEKSLTLLTHKLIEQLMGSLEKGEYDLYVFDEIFAALKRQHVTTEMVQKLIAAKADHVEVIFTGRNAPRELVALADYVTIMVKNKHPFDQGVPARQGIEY